jgi:hypothetical protein
MLSGMEDDGGLILNYFYGADVDFILENFDAAKEMYKKVFKCFLITWFRRYRDGEIDVVPPCEWEELEV